MDADLARINYISILTRVKIERAWAWFFYPADRKDICSPLHSLTGTKVQVGSRGIVRYASPDRFEHVYVKSFL